MTRRRTSGADIRVALVPLDRVTFHPHNVRRDLGDLRTLADSLASYGVMQPIVVERRGEMLRVRAGHRRVAAARLAGLEKVPAVIHPEPLDDDEWIAHAVQENVMRRGLSDQERRDAITAMRNLGCTWQGIADTFGASENTVKRWAESRKQRVYPQMSRVSVRTFIQQWRDYPDTTAAEILAALEAMATSGRLSDGLPTTVLRKDAA